MPPVPSCTALADRGHRCDLGVQLGPICSFASSASPRKVATSSYAWNGAATLALSSLRCWMYFSHFPFFWPL